MATHLTELYDPLWVATHGLGNTAVSSVIMRLKFASPVIEFG